jgi:hypothetical protein
MNKPPGSQLSHPCGRPKGKYTLLIYFPDGDDLVYRRRLLVRNRSLIGIILMTTHIPSLRSFEAESIFASSPIAINSSYTRS